jgi:hypothetical protein
MSNVAKSALEPILDHVREQIRHLLAVESVIVREMDPTTKMMVADIPGGTYRRGQTLKVSMHPVADLAADVIRDIKKKRARKPKINIAAAAKVALGKAADGFTTNELLAKLGSVVGGKKPAATLYAVLTRNQAFKRGDDHKWRLS